MCMARGLGCEQNAKEAFRYCKEASDSGFPLAKFLLAEFYEKGVGCTRDSTTARTLKDEVSDLKSAMIVWYLDHEKIA